ncbi:hypothetical protein C8J57DRAFT_1594450 [Mycena rebaudengoi]|nr:hypothetical protein C8J57DRAFT_1594450 [Mycena rebaudengoi]
MNVSAATKMGLRDRILVLPTTSRAGPTLPRPPAAARPTDSKRTVSASSAAPPEAYALSTLHSRLKTLEDAQRVTAHLEFAGEGARRRRDLRAEGGAGGAGKVASGKRPYLTVSAPKASAKRTHSAAFEAEEELGTTTAAQGGGWEAGGSARCGAGGETTLEFGESPAPFPTSTHVFSGIAHPAESVSRVLSFLFCSFHPYLFQSSYYLSIHFPRSPRSFPLLVLSLSHSLGGSGVGSGAGGVGASVPVAINPFKSNTLSRSSLSASLLRGVSSAGGIGAGVGGGAGLPGGGVAFPQQQSPAPPPTGTSAGSDVAGNGTVGAILVRKCYSSNFPHRYGAAAGSSVAAGRAGAAGAARSRSGSFLKSAAVPDEQQPDDISAFVKDIDAPRPLLGRSRLEQQQRKDQEGQQQDCSLSGDSSAPSGSSGSSPGTSRGGTVRGSGSTAGARTIVPAAAAFDGGAHHDQQQQQQRRSPAGAMLTSESEVDERLRRMNEEFMRSLVGLGRGPPPPPPPLHSPATTRSPTAAMTPSPTGGDPAWTRCWGGSSLISSRRGEDEGSR